MNIRSRTQRVMLGEQMPASYRALLDLAAAVKADAATTGLDPRLIELIRVRVSQINGCAFCLRLHTRDALAAGETADRLAVLPAWRETALFTDNERAALGLAESITLVGETHVDDPAYDAAADVLGDAQLAAVAWLATVMNAMNRVAITSRYRIA